MSTVEETRVDVRELTALELHGPIHLQASAVQGIQKMLELIDEEYWRESPHTRLVEIQVLCDRVNVRFRQASDWYIVRGTFENRGNIGMSEWLGIDQARVFASVIRNATGPVTIEIDTEARECKAGNMCVISSDDMTASVHILASNILDKGKPDGEEQSCVYMPSESLKEAVRIASVASGPRYDGWQDDRGATIAASISDSYPHVKVFGTDRCMCSSALIDSGVMAIDACGLATDGESRITMYPAATEVIGNFNTVGYSRVEIGFYVNERNARTGGLFVWTKDGSEGREQISVDVGSSQWSPCVVDKIFQDHAGDLKETQVTVKQLRDAVNMVQDSVDREDQLAIDLRMNGGSATVSTRKMTIGPFGVSQYGPQAGLYGDLREQGRFTAITLAKALTYDGEVRFADRDDDDLLLIEVRTREMKVSYLIAGVN